MPRKPSKQKPRAVEPSLAPINPAHSTKLPLQPQRPESEEKVIPIAQREVVLAAVQKDPIMRPIITTLLFTGMRIGEPFSLPLKACHKDYVVGGEKTEAGKNRIIPVRPEGKAYFEYFAQKAEGDLLLSGYEGQKVAANFRRR